MYLSKLILNPRTRRVRRELGNPYELHRSLMRSFPETLPAGERVLFRVDVDPRTGIPTVLLQSHTRPDWAWLTDDGARDYLLPNHLLPPTLQPPQHLSLTDFDFSATFTPDQILTFRLRANPTIKHSEPGQRQGRRDPLYREDAQLAWLERKGENGGFRILRADIIAEGNAYARKPRPAGGPRRKLTHHAVRFEGRLQVTDPDALWESVKSGIGPAKSFGFGLLSLARAR